MSVQTASKIRMRDSGSWYRLHEDGEVELVVLRRVSAAEGGYFEVVVRGDTVEEAEREYEEFCSASGEKSLAQAQRRARWGPREIA